ncbi:MAG TPA: glycosyltransferase [Pyrinomonadaceae bacterium]|nr:glycosyltransferase [Pyrinomonadaceae bacterium]
MRVLHVIPAIAACYGGPSKVVIDTCKALRQAGIEAEIATTNADETGDRPIPQQLPVSIETVPVYLFRRLGALRYKPSWPLTRWLEQNVQNYDLLHIHAVFSYSTAAAAYYARRNNVPYVLMPHGMLNPWPVRQKRLLKRLYLTAVERKNLASAAALQFTADDELENSSVKGRANLVLPYVLDLDLPANGHHPSRPQPRILFLSRLDPKKGIELLIEALRDLADADHQFDFVIAGSGAAAYEEHLRRKINASGKLAARTSFAGFVEGPGKINLLQSSDLFVLPSFDENFGIAVAEAMASRLAVIITDKVNIHDQIAREAAGLVVPPTAEALRDAVAKLLTNPKLRDDCAARGQQLVRTTFSSGAVTEETIKVYRDVIENSRHSDAWRVLN